MDGLVLRFAIDATDGKGLGDISLKVKEGKEVFRIVGLEL